MHVPPSSLPPQTADPTDYRVRPMHAAVNIADRDRSQAVNTADCSHFHTFITISMPEKLSS